MNLPPFPKSHKIGWKVKTISNIWISGGASPVLGCWMPPSSPVESYSRRNLEKQLGRNNHTPTFPLTFWQTHITIVSSQRARSKSSPSIISLCVDLISKSFPKLLVPDLTAVCKMPWWKNQSFAAFYTNLELYHSLLSCWMGALKLNVMSRGWGINPWMTFNFPAAKKPDI